jgi:hypothetical protein
MYSTSNINVSLSLFDVSLVFSEGSILGIILKYILLYFFFVYGNISQCYEPVLENDALGYNLEPKSFSLFPQKFIFFCFFSLLNLYYKRKTFSICSSQYVCSLLTKIMVECKSTFCCKNCCQII